MARASSRLLVRAERRRLLFSFPSLCVGIPNAVGEESIEIGKVCITVDEEVQPFAIFFTRPLASPHFPSRIIAVEVRTAERRPAAVRTTFNVAAAVMALADTRAAIGTGSAFHHPLPLSQPRARTWARPSPAGGARSERPPVGWCPIPPYKIATHLAARVNHRAMERHVRTIVVSGSRGVGRWIPTLLLLLRCG
jgi:hypothetical protein